MPRRERPLDVGESSLLKFAGDLRRLRQKAGSPTYRNLAERAHYSAATLSEAAAGCRLPTLSVAVAYVEACDGDVRQWRQRWQEVAAELAAADSEAGGAEREGPADGTGEVGTYRGLAAFEAEDADWFFGRERLVDAVTAQLQKSATSPATPERTSSPGTPRARCGATPVAAKGRSGPVRRSRPGGRGTRACSDRTSAEARRLPDVH